MGGTKRMDEELGFLLRDFIESGILRAGAIEQAVAEKVMVDGIQTLTVDEHHIWEARILPIVSKPLSEQQAIAKIVAKRGRVPRKIEF